MSTFRVGLKMVYGGFKTMFGVGTKAAAKTTAATKTTATAFRGPSLMDRVKMQPLALPAPTAEQLAADIPQVAVSKVFGGRVKPGELRMSQEILADGSHVRYFRGPGSDKVLIKMKDKGKVHEEWISSNYGDLYVKSSGDGSRYVVNKNGKFTQVEQRSVQYKDGMDQTVSTNDLYYTGEDGMKLHMYNGNGVNKGKTKCDITGKIYDDEYGITTNEIGHLSSVLAPSGKVSLSSLSDRPFAFLDTIGDTYTKAQRLFNSAREVFIRNIDEAIFKA